MLIFRKTSTLAVRHVFDPNVVGSVAEAAVKDGAAFLGRVTEEAAGKIVGDWAKKVAERVRGHFTDHSKRLTEALAKSNERAWKTIEISLGGQAFWDRFRAADDKALCEQVRSFLASAVPEDDPGYLAACLKELRQAREKGHLDGAEGFEPHSLAGEIGPFERFDDPEILLAAECSLVEEIADELSRLGYRRLGRLLKITPTRGQPLLAMAVQYYFRRAVEEDETLARGLAWARAVAIDRHVQDGFAFLAMIQERHGQNLEEALDSLVRIETVVSAIRNETSDIHVKVIEILRRLDLPRRDLSSRHSYSCQDDRERRLVADMLRRYRALDEEQRRQFPQLLLDASRLEIALGDYSSASNDATVAARWLHRPADRAVAHHTRYMAALEAHEWKPALEALRDAVALDPGLAPWPPGSEIEEILGAGGFAVAFRARRPHLKGHVVYKTFKADVIDQDIDAVFREAEILENLHEDRHCPGIIRLLECGYADPDRKQRPYIKLEHFRDSVTLETLINTDGKLEPDNYLPIAVQVAEALQTAHEAGVLHRDVKPGNILVRKSARGWEAKVIDFGLSLRRSLVQASQARAASMNRSMVGSAVAGTLNYAAPEQLDPERTGEVGPHSDVFGFGRTCLFALFATTQPRARLLRELPEPWPDLLDDCCDPNVATRLKDFGAVRERLVTTWDSDDVVADEPSPKEKAGVATATAEGAWRGKTPGDLRIVRLGDQELRFLWCPAPAGSFKMGSPTSEAGRYGHEDQVNVTFTHGFWMLETEVTQGLWQAVVGTKLDWSSTGEGPNMPVYNVSHPEAAAFCARLTELLRNASLMPSSLKISLPTEAQWEYAARAGTTTRFAFGDDEKQLGEHAWFDGNSGGKPHDVKNRRPNAWGLYDMAGNVWEWCADAYQAKLPGGADPFVAGEMASHRAVRGGCWNCSPRLCRSALRIRSAPERRINDLGFRVAAVQE